MNLLVVGFEPFAGARVNPSGELARALEGEVAPVDSQRLGPWLDEVLARRAPTRLLGLGESRGSAAVRVERVALNLLDFEIPDAAGRLVRDRAIVPAAPSALFSSFPAWEMRDAIRAQGIPAVVSWSAGAYLCNQLFFLSCHRGLEAGFLHLPSLPEQVAQDRQPAPSMELSAQLQAVEAACRVILR